MPLYDRYLIVDWSAANAPKGGKDSIWMAMADRHGLRREPVNPRTRHEAMEIVRSEIRQTLATGERLFAGFDFAFGYPAGIADRIGQPVSSTSSQGGWTDIWRALAKLVRDQENNSNNSYDLAARFNQEFFADCGEGPFWGHPHQHGGRYPGLAPKKDKSAFEMVREFRHAERSAKGAKSVWQLAYNGTVGRQAMLGMARLEMLRSEPEFASHCAVWPFESRFAQDTSKPVLIAEVYPSLYGRPARVGNEVLDSAQVRDMATRFAALDGDDAFLPLISRPEDMDDAAAEEVIREEGWIVGAGCRT